MVKNRARAGHERGTTYRLLPLFLTLVLFMGCNRKGASDYLAAGDIAMQNTRLAEAESDYQQAVKMAPNDARPHVALASFYLFERKPQQAQTELMKALELDPANPKTHVMLAKAYRAQSELGLAESQGRAAVALAPANPEYRMDLGTTLQNEQKVGAAEAEFRTAAGLEPRNAQSHLALAALLNSEPNRQAEAQAEYAQVKALAPNLVPSEFGNGNAAVAKPAGTAPASIPPVAPAPAIKDTNKRFVLSHDSPVYESMNEGARVVAQVHRRRYVHVTGIGGQWLRIQLRNGTIGFIPASAAE